MSTARASRSVHPPGRRRAVAWRGSRRWSFRWRARGCRPWLRVRDGMFTRKPIEGVAGVGTGPVAGGHETCGAVTVGRGRAAARRLRLHPRPSSTPVGGLEDDGETSLVPRLDVPGDVGCRCRGRRRRRVAASGRAGSLARPGRALGVRVADQAPDHRAAAGHHRAGDVPGRRGVPPLMLVLLTLVGGCLAAASANVFNCVLDRDIDERMRRTRRRPLPRHMVVARGGDRLRRRPRGGCDAVAGLPGQLAVGRCWRSARTSSTSSSTR